MHTSHTRFSRSSEASSLITLLSAARREGNLLQVGKRAQRQRLGHDEHRCVVTSFITFTAHRARPAPLLRSPNPASWQTFRCRLPLCVCMCAVGGRLSCLRQPPNPVKGSLRRCREAGLTWCSKRPSPQPVRET